MQFFEIVSFSNRMVVNNNIIFNTYLLVHIVDVSHPQFEEQIEVVNKTLAEIDKQEKPMIIVFNKIDAFSFVKKDEDDLTPSTRENVSLDELKRTWMNRLQDNCIFISAKNRTNVDELKTMLYTRVREIHTTRFPYNDFLFQQYDDVDDGNLDE